MRSCHIKCDTVTKSPDLAVPLCHSVSLSWPVFYTQLNIIEKHTDISLPGVHITVVLKGFNGCSLVKVSLLIVFKLLDMASEVFHKMLLMSYGKCASAKEHLYDMRLS